MWPAPSDTSLTAGQNNIPTFANQMHTRHKTKVLDTRKLYKKTVLVTEKLHTNVITWIMGMENIKQQTSSHTAKRLYGCRSKFVDVGLDCSCSSSMWCVCARNVSIMPLPFSFKWIQPRWMRWTLWWCRRLPVGLWPSAGCGNRRSWLHSPRQG